MIQVAKVIEILKKDYKPDEEIMVLWWTKEMITNDAVERAGYATKRHLWEDALRDAEDTIDYCSNDIWNAIDEAVQERIRMKEEGDNNEQTR